MTQLALKESSLTGDYTIQQHLLTAVTQALESALTGDYTIQQYMLLTAVTSLGVSTDNEETTRYLHLLTAMTQALKGSVECCFTSTEPVGLLGTGAQNGHLDFHTAPEI